MKSSSPLGTELVFAGSTIVVITILYLIFMAISGKPAASGLIGHSIGILGFLLMIATETLYSVRKRSQGRPLGRMSDWLRFHIYTGIVGPYLVLLHTSWQFNGLAGVTLLLTMVIVLSGFIGRYIYTAVPRTVHGAVVEQQVIQQQLAEVEQQLAAWQQPSKLGLASGQGQPAAGIGAVLLRGPLDLIRSWQDRRQLRSLGLIDRAQVAEVANLIQRSRALQRQIQSLTAARRLLALWHTIHVPLGITLFLLAFIHIGAALYYATLLK